MSEIYVKKIVSDNITEELANIEFDKSYVAHAVRKNSYTTLKVHKLSPQEASILKQSALALGFDAAVNRGVLDCSVEYSDAILSGSLVQFERLSQSLMRQPFKMKTVAALILNEINTETAAMVVGGLSLKPNKSHIMGILNVTPDSFFDGGRYATVDAACARFVELCEDGADMIDIGAESTRPGYTPIDADEEISRIKPVLKAIQEMKINKPVSVDTRNAKTAEIALELGASCINDVSFGENDKNMLDFVNANSIPYVLTHSLNVTEEKDVVSRIYVDVLKKLDKISAPVIVDVGLGFGKTQEQNFELIKRISEFKSLKKMLLVGHSCKSFLAKEFEPKIATEAVSCALMRSGVELIRVHDVKSHKTMLEVCNKLG